MIELNVSRKLPATVQVSFQSSHDRLRTGNFTIALAFVVSKRKSREYKATSSRDFENRNHRRRMDRRNSRGRFIRGKSKLVEKNENKECLDIVWRATDCKILKNERVVHLVTKSDRNLCRRLNSRNCGYREKSLGSIVTRDNCNTCDNTSSWSLCT